MRIGELWLISSDCVDFDGRWQFLTRGAIPWHQRGHRLRWPVSDEDIQSRGWIDSQGKVNERFKTVEQGASTSVWAATAPDLVGRGGVYLEDCSIADVVAARPEMPKGVMQYAIDPEIADQLWHRSEEMIAVK